MLILKTKVLLKAALLIAVCFGSMHFTDKGMTAMDNSNASAHFKMATQLSSNTDFIGYSLALLEFIDNLTCHD